MTTVIALSKDAAPQVWKTEHLAVAVGHNTQSAPKHIAVRPLSIADVSGYMDRFAAMEMRGQMADAPLGKLNSRA